ncbi:uncharacterized protein [Gossypium hirsutum]|uniref:Reverse transcriptase domain-containing protein n=1 Tax=Gossypium hirsutum TaxID=3635 RepID=A0ABM2ZXN3_GOSHI|nr:uncharacterized protein LOC107917463 [Gossypium hirsutum]
MAVLDMGSTKAPEEDGFQGLFYQKCWHIIGDEVTNFCLHLLNGDMETLVNQFKRVIGKCIDATQSTFVPERLISNNVLLACKTLNTLKQKKMGKKDLMAVKLDMSKAYDRFKWEFIKQLMIQMGFANRWVEAIMQCVTTVSYLVVMNGHRGEKFQQTRGLRQGNKVSIWNDRRVQGMESLERHNRSDSMQLEFVLDLIDSMTRKWKEELINNTFHPEVARTILQIPLSESVHEDFQVGGANQQRNTQSVAPINYYKLLI